MEIRLAYRAVNKSAYGKGLVARAMERAAGAPASLGSSMTTSADPLIKDRNLMPITPHNDLNPTARDDTQKEGGQEPTAICASNIVIVLVEHRFASRMFPEGGESDFPSFATGYDQITAGERRAGAD